MALNRKIAYIDLTSGDIKTTSIPIELRKTYIGGRGLDIYLLFNHLQEKVEPFSPDNVVVVGAGLLGGTLASASARTHIMSKSPLTEYLASTNMGGFFAPELRWAGFDHLVIKGRSKKPAYIFIHDGKIKIRDASSIWGQKAQEAQEILREELRDEQIQTLCIGPSGEKLVRFANLITRHQNAGGRTGIGAVFGSKNLKAIVARGTMGIDIKFPKEALEYDKQIVRDICSTKFGQMMQRWGSMCLYGLTHSTGLVRTHNFQLNQLADSQRIEFENIDEYSFGMDGCFGCQLHCRHRYIIEEEPYSGVYAQGPGNESLEAWGTKVSCQNMNTILVGNYLANSYGIDTVETGSLISWAMNLYEKGILTDQDTGGLKLEFGNDEAVIEMIHRIGRREGLGDILAEGGLRAAQKIADGSQKYGFQVEGIAEPQPDEIDTPDLALGIVTATLGSDQFHSRSFIDLYQLTEPALRNIYSKPHPYNGPLSSDYQGYEGKPWRVFWHELCYMAADMIGMCKFHTVFVSPYMPSFEEFSKMIYLNTGLILSAEEIWECAERAYNLERLFNIREGAIREDNSLLDRYFDEPTSLGLDGVRGKTLDRTRFKAIIDEYYQIHGWDENGVPKPETLERLDLDREPSHKVLK